MRKINTCLFCLLAALWFQQSLHAQNGQELRLRFQRTGTTTESVKISITDAQGQPVEGASASLTSSYTFRPTAGKITPEILCPNANANTSPSIRLAFQISGVPAGLTFNQVALDLHALNGSSNYQDSSDGVTRQYNISINTGTNEADISGFGGLRDIDLAAGVSTDGLTHKIWKVNSDKTYTAGENLLVMIDITKGSTNAGCFAGLSEIRIGMLDPDTDLPDLQPFHPSAAVGKPEYRYHITRRDGAALCLKADGQLAWTEKANDAAQTWYFVGTSNRNEGYLIVNEATQQPYSLPGETDTRWYVISNPVGADFYFRPYATREDPSTNLTIEGDSLVCFQLQRSAFSLANQIYEMPCGNLGNCYLTQFSVGGNGVKPLYYPLAVKAGNSVVRPDASRPESWYTLYTLDKAGAAPGQQLDIDMQLNQLPPEGTEVYLYADWNRDGVFETQQTVTPGQHMTARLQVPADAATGSTRLRLRLTENGMAGADDEVIGQIFDCILNLLPEVATPTLTVLSNSTDRGTVSPTTDEGLNKECEVTATPLGNASFICWREGNNIVSLQPVYRFTLSRPTTLTACFSPNTETGTGIGSIGSGEESQISISTHRRMVKITSPNAVREVLVYTPSGTLMVRSTSTTLQLTDLPAGSYIVKVRTDQAEEAAKIVLK